MPDSGQSRVAALRVWTCTDFTGHYPVGTAAVVVAHDEDEASRLLHDALNDRGLTEGGFTLDELGMQPRVRVLCDGNY